MADYKRIEFTPDYRYPDDSLWRNTTSGLLKSTDRPDRNTDYAWLDKDARLDRVGYYPEYDAYGRSSGGGDWGGGSSGGSGGLYSMYGGGIDYLSQQQAALQSAREQAEAAQRSRVDAAVGDINAQQAGINRTADQSATQAYIARMKAERGMPQQQAALGLSGGASESAMLGLNTGYENSRNAIMRDRDAQIQANIDLQNKVRLEGDAALSDIQNAYAMKDLDLLQDQANRQAQYEQMVYQAQLAQQQWEQQQAAQMSQYERERQDYLADLTDQRAYQEQQTQAEREYQQMMQRMKGSGSSGERKWTVSEVLKAWDDGLIDDATANSMLGLAGAAAPAATGRMKMLDDWFASMTPQQFQANVTSGMARGLLSEDVYDEWARSHRR